MPLTEKYKLKNFADIKGQDMVISRLKRFMQKFPEKKAIILNGPSGTGKTSLAYCLAHETNSEIIELNASDFRNSEQVSKIIGQASKQNSIFGKKAGKILLIDEVEGLTKEDRGGLQELISLISATSFPIIITSNDIWDKKFSELRRKAELVQLKELHYKIVFEIIRDIAEKENLNLASNLLLNLAIKARGDARAAINDLQTITSETLHEDIYERDKEVDIFNTLRQILQQLPNKETIFLYDKVNMSLDEILLWLEENVPKEYKGLELYKAFEAISKADVFRGRIHRQQHWRFLVYQNFLLSVGVSSAKKQVKLGFTAYKRPERILKIWLINKRLEQKKSIAGKYARHCHTSRKRALKEFPVIKHIIQNQKIQKQLNLEEKELDFLHGQASF